MTQKMAASGQSVPLSAALKRSCFTLVSGANASWNVLQWLFVSLKCTYSDVINRYEGAGESTRDN